MKRKSVNLKVYAAKRRRASPTTLGPALQISQVASRAVASRFKRSSLNARSGGFLGIEKKFYDTTLVAGVVNSSATMASMENDPASVNCLNGVDQGDGESQRDGRKIAMDSIQVSGHVRIPAQIDQTSLDLAPVVKVYLVLDKQTNGAQLNSEDVFVNPGASTATSDAPFKNLQYDSRFQILGVRTFTCPPIPATWDGTNMEASGVTLPFSIYKSLKGMQVTFKGTTAGVANIVDKSLHIIACCNAQNSAPTLYYNSRLRFRG